MNDQAQSLRDLLRRAAAPLRSPYLCNWDTQVAAALADLLEAEAQGPHDEDKLDALARALLQSFGLSEQDVLDDQADDHPGVSTPSMVGELRDAGWHVFAPGDLYLRRVEHDGVQMRVIPTALHNVLCNRRIATPQGTEPEVLGCAGCGFCYPAEV